MCKCDIAEEERDITNELVERLINVINAFADEYKGDIFEDHVVNSLRVVLINSCETYGLEHDSFVGLCKFMVIQYAKRLNKAKDSCK